MNITDFIAVLSLIGTVYGIGYQIGYRHGKHDADKEQKNNRPVLPR
jgi:hypothetical protein